MIPIHQPEVVVTLGEPSIHKITCGSLRNGVWRCTVPAPGFAIVTFPNGSAWDLFAFGGPFPENPWPVDEELKASVEYTGWVPPGYTYGRQFSIFIHVINPDRSS
jgi:hypothetical protein